MKTAKKTRTLKASVAKTRKTCATAAKASGPKKKKGGKVSVAKTDCTRTRSKDSPKSCKCSVAKKVKSTKRTKESGMAGKSVTKSKDRRHHRELSAGEYETFVIQAAAKEKVSREELVTIDRRKDKSTKPEQPVVEQTQQSQEKQGHRQKIQRRRQIDPTTCERDYSQEEIEFMNALDEYKRNSGRMFPTCSEILEVFRNLGYAKLLHDEIVEFNVNIEAGDVTITATEVDTTHLTNAPLLEMNNSGYR